MPAAPSAHPTGRPLRGLRSPHRLATPHRRTASTTGRCGSPASSSPPPRSDRLPSRPAAHRSSDTLIAPLPDRTGDGGTGAAATPHAEPTLPAAQRATSSSSPYAPLVVAPPSPEAAEPGTHLSPFGRPAPNGLPCWQRPRPRVESPIPPQPTRSLHFARYGLQSRPHNKGYADTLENFAPGPAEESPYKGRARIGVNTFYSSFLSLHLRPPTCPPIVPSLPSPPGRLDNVVGRSPSCLRVNQII